MNIYNKYLSSVAGICFDTPNDQGAKKTPQQLAAEERAKIDVTQNPPEKTAEELEADKKTADDAAKAKTEADEKAAKEKEETDKKKATEGGEEEVIDTTEKDPEKLLKTIERLQKRVDKLTGKVKLTETEKNEIATKLAQIQEGKEALLTEEDVETRAEAKAAQKVAERQFVDACNKIFDASEKVDKNFKKKVDAMAEEIGPIPGQMIGILEDLPDAGAILVYLTDNVDIAEDVYKLSPGKMANELNKISRKIEEDAAKKAKEAKEKDKKEISKVPSQTEPPGGTSKTDTNLRDDEPMDDWIRKRNQQVAEKRRLKAAGV